MLNYAFSSYSILQPIGSGHFGAVSKGTWTCAGFTQDVAVKTVKSNTETERIKLLQEAAIMGQFAHSNVVKVKGVVTMGDPVSSRSCDDHMKVHIFLT